MSVIFKPNTAQEKIDALIGRLEDMGFSHHLSRGTETTLVGLIGDTSKVDIDSLRANDIVADVKRVSEPYKAANRKFHPQDTVITVKGRSIGGGSFGVIAGPCSVESHDQMLEVAQQVQACGAGLLRGGAFKPRTSPYAFQGLHAQGLEFLLEAGRRTGLPVVTEIMDLSHLELFRDVDIIQVGARNMQNFELLRQLGHTGKPILLKRGLANTLEEFLMSAEYILSGGNSRVILCERGIRTFETMTRNTLDLSAVPLLKRHSHLPVIVDPSHATGLPYLVEPLAKAAVAAGADGLMIEVHNDPKNALCDGAQSLTPSQFQQVMAAIAPYLALEGKSLSLESPQS